MYRSVNRARWYSHVNGINPPGGMRGWLTDPSSLTLKLMQRGGSFRVQRLCQRTALCLPDEFRLVGLGRPVRVQERDVLLRCGQQPMVYAHTILPLDATAGDWPFFSALGERSLGTILFGDPSVSRGPMQYARLLPHHPLARRTSAALSATSSPAPLFARRRLFHRRKGLLLVTEVFLPAIAEIGLANTFHKQNIE
ncbi:MAG TPA: chorismate lyase [Noviherbaspirillum sp.]|jgi:chorismate--pyruvate lyase|uniref:chorismate--pyruvate lyase family protein n=1 Tax=Noviherbaspirillum sp. TaxID=1926288 RepID=UPI002DDCEE9A|nr:chorismate lyase [Noviherbaspirillum sp.]HEV2611544.1 chorismate lyase [Noviherbaspirillum sp.]